MHGRDDEYGIFSDPIHYYYYYYYVPHFGNCHSTAPRVSGRHIKAFRCRSPLESAEVYRKKAFFDLAGFLVRCCRSAQTMHGHSWERAKFHNSIQCVRAFSPVRHFGFSFFFFFLFISAKMTRGNDDNRVQKSKCTYLDTYTYFSFQK